MTIDTLTYAEELQDAGVNADQAKAHARALNKAIRDGVATKADIADLRATLRVDIADLETRVIRWIVVQGIAIITVNAAVIATALSVLR